MSNSSPKSPTESQPSRRGFLRGAAQASLAATAAVTAATVGAKPAQASASCSDLEKKMETGRRSAASFDKLTEASLESAKEAVEALKTYERSPSRRTLASARELSEKAAKNIQRYLDWNRDGKANFIMVHDEGHKGR